MGIGKMLGGRQRNEVLQIIRNGRIFMGRKYMVHLGGGIHDMPPVIQFRPALAVLLIESAQILLCTVDPVCRHIVVRHLQSILVLSPGDILWLFFQYVPPVLLIIQKHVLRDDIL